MTGAQTEVFEGRLVAFTDRDEDVAVWGLRTEGRIEPLRSGDHIRIHNGEGKGVLDKQLDFKSRSEPVPVGSGQAVLTKTVPRNVDHDTWIDYFFGDSIYTARVTRTIN